MRERESPWEAVTSRTLRFGRPERLVDTQEPTSMVTQESSCSMLLWRRSHLPQQLVALGVVASINSETLYLGLGQVSFDKWPWFQAVCLPACYSLAHKRCSSSPLHSFPWGKWKFFSYSCSFLQSLFIFSWWEFPQKSCAQCGARETSVGNISGGLFPAGAGWPVLIIVF